MAKSRMKAKRKLQTQSDHPQATKKVKVLSSTDDSVEPPTLSLQTLFTEDEIETTLEVLNVLSEYPALIKSKSCRELRSAVYDFRQACTTGLAAADTNSSLTARVSGALADGLYAQARILLAEMRIKNEAPKLGSLCRWVRDLDVVSGLAEQRLRARGTTTEVAERSQREIELLTVLDAILRASGPIDYSNDNDENVQDHNRPLSLRRKWDLREGASGASDMVYHSVLNSSIFDKYPMLTEKVSETFRIIDTTPGLQRKPPNLHPAILYASKDDTICLSLDGPKTTHHHHPAVPNLHLMRDVLTGDECKQIIATAETIGFTPDAPIRAEGEESSILAHNFYWIVDSAFAIKLWNRVAQFVPSIVDRKRARGLNRRFRVYRYVPGAEYRAHIDGAWPPSGIDAATDKYIYDSSPAGAKQSSLFTFLIYLNDEFEAGETTFFLPSAREGVMNAYPVKPIQGSVALFPHGDTNQSVLHEGTGVLEEADGKKSAKYVIRTDVLYDIDPISEDRRVENA